MERKYKIPESDLRMMVDFLFLAEGEKRSKDIIDVLDVEIYKGKETMEVIDVMKDEIEVICREKKNW